ncbi:hypothetical protein RvY_12018 [Ramazzottius varieornatus]|uniref:beta-glucosidase n=1 Tax=Ramazzottius varieornatus TaxID=947166 RepID=A0A1D1VK38_RAMVA|nr:hypothetical protein RvY_12018 [Ramazzottius varieornatus]
MDFAMRIFIVGTISRLFCGLPCLECKLSPEEIETRINELVGNMTLAEKLGQLQQLDGDYVGTFQPYMIDMVRNGLLGSTINVRGANQTNTLQRYAVESRLKIPVLFGFDVIHGYRTLFPIPLGETASWDLDAVEQASAIAAAETRSVGLHWTFAPMIDITRDPRWGRVMEGQGEDVYLGNQMAKARVRGFQGDDYSRPDKVLACAKHFAGYGAAEGGRDYNTVDMSERRLRETYLPPFKAAIDAGVGSFMTAFNDLSGVPATANEFLLREILRDEWKFDGLVVSDYDAVVELTNHQLSANDSEAAMYALNAGTDMEMISRTYNTHGPQLVQSGKVSTATIDGAVRNVLRIKFRLGLFDNPFVDETLEDKIVFKKEHRDAARNITARTLVLVKNENNTLPIDKNIGKIAVIGGLAADRIETLDHWAGDAKWENSTTMLEGIMEKLGVTDTTGRVTYAEGCNAYCRTSAGFDAAVRVAEAADFVVLVVGEPREYSGEGGSKTDLDLPGYQLDLVKRIRATGKPFVAVVVNGRPMTLEELHHSAPAVLITWRSGTMGGHAIADVLFGDVNPSGKLPMSFPRNVGQIPLYYDYKNTGRPVDRETNSPDIRDKSKYLDVLNSPLYPFGFGLSYTNFVFGNLRLNATSITAEQNVTVSVDVRNLGTREGEEVVQLYIRDVAASITRPTRQLKAFRKLRIPVDQSERVDFVLMPQRDFSFLDDQWHWLVEEGQFEIYVGNSSDTNMYVNLTVTTTAHEPVEHLTTPSMDLSTTPSFSSTGQTLGSSATTQPASGTTTILLPTSTSPLTPAQTSTISRQTDGTITNSTATAQTTPSGAAKSDPPALQPMLLLFCLVLFR